MLANTRSESVPVTQCVGLAYNMAKHQTG